MRSFPERSPKVKRREEPADWALIQFLRQHRPPVPSASSDLEDRIMAALDAPSTEPRFKDTRLTGAERLERSRRLRWMLPTAVAASLVAGLYSSQMLRTSPASDSEVAKLEAFIASAWSTPTENPHSEAEFASQVLMELPEETEP